MDEKELRRLLSFNIKNLRHLRDWSQAKLAEKIDVSVNFLADIETGKSWVSSFTLVKLANVFEIDVFELFRPEKQTGNETKELIARVVHDISAGLNHSLDKITGRYLS
jgi:transcriptional regulator with XRE-family HTH domain